MQTIHQYARRLCLDYIMGCAKPVQTTLYILRRNGKRKVVFQYLKKIGNAYVDYNGEQHAQILGENIAGKDTEWENESSGERKRAEKRRIESESERV